MNFLLYLKNNISLVTFPRITNSIKYTVFRYNYSLICVSRQCEVSDCVTVFLSTSLSVRRQKNIHVCIRVSDGDILSTFQMSVFVVI